MAQKKTDSQNLFRQPSWWVVVVAGTLLVVFLVAIVREVVSWHAIKQQVSRLQSQVATAQTHQRQLQDLIDYLGSPTFQEREARLQLGLKKSGERVIVLPPSADSSNQGSTADANQGPSSDSTGATTHRWWSYFFSPRRSS